MKSFCTTLAAITLAAASPPAWAGEGNADVHGGVSRSCALGSCTGTKLSYGAAAGYDFDVSESTFVGVQAGIDGVKGYDGGTYANYSLVARVGAKFGAESLYALGGYAAQELGGGDGTANGWRLGVGYEHRFGKTLFVKAQYSYSQYSKYGISGGQNTGVIGVGTHF
ncbi:MAG: hypothetical protein RIS94_909 [Pseudomonadota bacterium]|jgi:opacity protein-like surface antigen